MLSIVFFFVFLDPKMPSPVYEISLGVCGALLFLSLSLNIFCCVLRCCSGNYMLLEILPK